MLGERGGPISYREREAAADSRLLGGEEERDESRSSRSFLYLRAI